MSLCSRVPSAKKEARTIRYGLFTLLDADQPSNVGLVQLFNAPGFYFDPDIGEPTPEHCVDGTSARGSRLFGQGAALAIQQYVIRDRQEHPGPNDDNTFDD